MHIKSSHTYPFNLVCISMSVCVCVLEKGGYLEDLNTRFAVWCEALQAGHSVRVISSEIYRFSKAASSHLTNAKIWQPPPPSNPSPFSRLQCSLSQSVYVWHKMNLPQITFLPLPASESSRHFASPTQSRGFSPGTPLSRVNSSVPLSWCHTNAMPRLVSPPDEVMNKAWWLLSGAAAEGRSGSPAGRSGQLRAGALHAAYTGLLTLLHNVCVCVGMCVCVCVCAYLVNISAYLSVCDRGVLSVIYMGVC